MASKKKSSKKAKVSFESEIEKDVPYGKNSFIRVAKTKIIGGERDGKFSVTLAKGFFREDGSETITRGFGFPYDNKEEIAKLIKEL